MSFRPIKLFDVIFYFESIVPAFPFIKYTLLSIGIIYYFTYKKVDETEFLRNIH